MEKASEDFPDWVSQKVINFFAESGIQKLFKWQRELIDAEIDNCSNLIFSAPTSSGKSIVAELLALKVAECGKKVIFVLPYISVAREKLHQIQRCWRRVDIPVCGFIGPQASNPSEWSAAICTIEKAASLMNRALIEDWFSDIGMIVIDELHMIFDSSRGAHLENMIAKIQFSNRNSPSKIRIIGMSATIPHLNKLGDWLCGKTYEINFRPIPVEENIVIGRKVMRIIGEKIQNCYREVDDDPVTSLAIEAFENESQVLIMCSSKMEAEKVSIMIAKQLNVLKYDKPRLITTLKSRENGLIYTKTCLERNGCKDRSLISALAWGNAFHHAGLTMEERECIEEAFREKSIMILAATSTLASGVNLPAERVIIKSQTRGPSAITAMSYRQMIGRAGRTGHATKGESYLVVRNSDEQNIEKIIFEPIDRNCINRIPSDIRKFILEAICTRLVVNRIGIKELTGKLFSDSSESVENAIDYLQINSFISVEEENLIATQLGLATIASSLPPDAALAIFEDLNTASRAIALDTELHMLYLVTPINVTVWHDCDWHHLFAIFSKMLPAHRRVAKLVGVSEKFLLDRMRGRNDEQKLKTHIRFFSALALFDLINENSIHEVSIKYRITRGCLQTLQSQSSTYAAMIVAFCLRLGWTYLKSLLDGFAIRLMFGIRSDLCELVTVDGIDGQRARILHEKGITCISHLAACDDRKLAHYLSIAVPYLRSDLNDGKGEWLFGESRMKIEDAVDLLKYRAKRMLQERIKELGISIDTTSIGLQKRPEPDSCDSGLGDSCTDSQNYNKISDEVEDCTQSMTEMSLVSKSDDEEDSVFEDENKVDCLETTLYKMKGPNDEKFRRRLSQTFSPSRFEQSPKASDNTTADDSFDLPVRGSVPSSLKNCGSNSQFESPISCERKRHNACSSILERTSDLPSTLCEEGDSFDKPVPGSVPYLRSLDRDNLRKTILEQQQERRNSLNITAENMNDTSRTQEAMNTTINSENRSFDIFESPPPKEESKVSLKHSRITYVASSPLSAFVSSPVLKHGKWDENHLQFEDICSSKDSWNKWLKSARSSSIVSIAMDEKCTGIAVTIQHGTVYIPIVQNYDGAISSSSFPTIPPCSIPLNDRIESLKLICASSDVYLYSLEIAYTLFCNFGIKLINPNFLLPLAHANNLLDIENKIIKRELFLQMMKKMEMKTAEEYEKNERIEYNLAIESFVSRALFENLKMVAMDMSSEESVNLELSASKTVLDMFYCGIEFDPDGCQSAMELLKRRCEHLEEECWKLAHGKFCIESSKQVANVLFCRLGLIYPDTTTSKASKHLTTSKQILEQVRNQHTIVDKIIKYRHIRHTLTQCLQPLSKYDRRIHCWFDMFTTTGRILTSLPNIQNVPKRESLDGVCARRLFRSKPGYVLIAADYSQLELRVLAHWSDDSNLVELIRKEHDLFEDLSEKWKFSRDAVKQLCYGLIYGMGVKSLAELTRLSIDESEKLQRKFFEMFPGVRSYINETKEKAFRDGFVETILGRRRLTNKSITGEEKSREERVVVNYTIQGTASEIFKTAIVEIGKRLKGINANIVMTIHDEVIVEAASELEFHVTKVMRECMQGSLSGQLRVPMRVTTKSGATWADLK